MARITAPSLWLPGFDPDAPEIPDPSPGADLLAEPATHEAPIALAAEVPTAVEASNTFPRASWRVISGANRDEPRPSWPALRREHLSGLSGTATKFEANVAAIQALQALEAGQRPPDATERGQLLRFTGWAACPPPSTSKARTQPGAAVPRNCRPCCPPRTTSPPAPRSTTVTTPRSM